MIDIKVLIKATGLTPSNSKGTLKDVLSDFTGDSEKRKSQCRRIADKELVGPVRNLHDLLFKREVRKRTRKCGVLSEKIAKRLEMVDEIYNERVDININSYNTLIEYENYIFCRWCVTIVTKLKKETNVYYICQLVVVQSMGLIDFVGKLYVLDVLKQRVERISS